MFGGRLASFGEIAVAAGYPCCMSYLAISMTTTTTTTPQATSVFTAATTHHVV
jgi:mevalonate kinase